MARVRWRCSSCKLLVLLCACWFWTIVLGVDIFLSLRFLASAMVSHAVLSLHRRNIEIISVTSCVSASMLRCMPFSIVCETMSTSMIILKSVLPQIWWNISEDRLKAGRCGSAIVFATLPSAVVMRFTTSLIVYASYPSCITSRIWRSMASASHLQQLLAKKLIRNIKLIK